MGNHKQHVEIRFKKDLCTFASTKARHETRGMSCVTEELKIDDRGEARVA
jgi:hypothetical protein